MPKAQRIQEEADETEINLSPMIDCIFILLIFFIVTTVFVEEPGVEVDKPFALTAERLEKNSILIAITEDNKVVYGGNEVGITGVGTQVRQALLQQDYPVIILADEQSDQGVFAKVYREVNLAGATRIFFSTENE
ncbi:MAG: ExbD/TolR family protein [Opitutales bacterium]